MKKQILSAILLCSVLLAACGTPTETGTESTTAAKSEETTVDNTPKLELPESNYDGKTFSILSTVHAEYEYVAEEITGDVVSDAIYNRNKSVEDLLNIKLNIITQPGHWADKDTFNALVKNSVMAGDGAYDLINGVTVCVLPIASEGVFIDANELSYVNFDNPWWVQGMNENLAIGGKLFGFIGDASLSLYKDLSVIYFNKGLIENYQCENPYDLVKSGDWTVEKFIEMSMLASKDIDGDGSMKNETDQFGYIGHYVPQRAFQTSTEVKVVDFNDDGNPFIADLAERDVDIFMTLNKFLMDRTNVWVVDVSDHSQIAKVFSADRAMFMCDFLYDTEYLRDMTTDFGIIPMPKRNKEQENYHVQIGTSTSMFFVPKTTNDVDLTSKVCEALSYYSYRDVTPAYYEIALKEKYTRDEDVKEMLEIIRNAAQMDFTYAYSTNFDPFPNCLTEFRENNTIGDNLASYYATNQVKWQAKIDDILKAYAELE